MEKIGWRTLECFVKVAQLGSFTRASIALGIAQPEVSRKINQLEVRLHQRLFNRNGRGVELTDEGTIVLNHCIGMFNQFDRMYQEVSAARESPVGKVVIGITNATSRVLASTFITAFRNRFTNASLEIIEGRTRILADWVTAGRVDIAILQDISPSPLLEAMHLYDVDLQMISLGGRSAPPKERPIPFRELARHPLILPSKFHSVRNLVEREAEKSGIQLNIALEVEGARLILELVQLGYGNAILPVSALERTSFPRRFRTTPIVSPVLKRSFSTLMSKQRPSTLLMRETFTLIRETLTKSAQAA